VHQAAPATIEKLRWLLAKATATFGELQLIDLRAEKSGRGAGCCRRATASRPRRRAGRCLERQDVDRAGGAVYVRRQFARGHLRPPKTRRSLRSVPIQSVALEAIEQSPASESPLLFPAPRGGHIDMHNFRAREWRRAQLAVGIDPCVGRTTCVIPTRPPRSVRAHHLLDDP
jgi:hypothetical protein